ncbi:hypothetical protein DMC64_12545 [Amycolatopsis sp. WAC 04197]|uniref:hypothetical protein n=1 Tax=Amycolatopsis sp. WAC 04197 TaxID=2203199 RepID=UPI000F78F0FC|nr:hypothetical protein [Amycolatopsis sp. WAC 04197]RSN48034.1 hypothetical protein DMC64_12545 [Amycolatopsis sp. WAC 04197]
MPNDDTVDLVRSLVDATGAAVDAYRGGYYRPGDKLPVKILVQFDRTAGKYEVTFEDTDEDRWAVKPKNFRTMREQLRPKLG